MENTQPPPPATPAPEKKRRGCFGLAFKSALGCAAFAFGSLVVLVLLLPTLCGSFIASAVEKSFHASYRGTLSIEGLDLAWTRQQEVRNAVLRAPDGSEVARASVTLPSLFEIARSDGSRFGSVHVVLNASLVADDAGVTNLERALEPNPDASPAAKKHTRVDSDKGAIDQLAELDVELVIESQHLSWSDAETRRVGVPFEVRDLKAVIKTRPGEPITAHAGASIAADPPGELALDATLHGPLQPSKAWPVGQVDAKLVLKGFSSAMLDGLANQHGRLKELLGQRFDLRVEATGATPSAGDLVLALESPGAQVHLAGHFDGSAFHASNAPDQGVEIPLPRGYIESFVTPLAPAGSKLVVAADPGAGKAGAPPWTVRIAKLELPIPDRAVHGSKDVAPYLEKLACDVTVDLPARIGFENESTRALGAAPSLAHTRLGVHVEPGQPVAVGLTSDLDMNGRADFGAKLVLRDAWKSLAQGATPHVDAQIELTNVDTAAIDALARQDLKLAPGLGPKVSFRAHASDASTDSGTFGLEVGSEHLNVALSGRLERGRVRCSGSDELLVSADPPPAWIAGAIAPHLPKGMTIVVAPAPLKLEAREVTFVLPQSGQKSAGALDALNQALALQLSCDLPGLRVSSDSTGGGAKLPMDIGASHLAATLGLEGRLSLAFKAPLDTGVKGSVSITAESPDVWKVLRAKQAADPLPLTAKVALDGVSTGTIDDVVGDGGLLARALGPRAGITADVSATSLRAGSVHLGVDAPSLALGFRGKLDGGALRCTGDEGLDVAASLSDAFVAHDLAPKLPAGTQISWPSATAKQPIRLTLREVTLPLPDPASPAPADAAHLVPLLESASAALRVEVDALNYSDEHTRAAKVAVALRDVSLDASVAPKKPLTVKLHSAIEAGGKGALDASVLLKDPWAALKPDAKLAPLDASVKLTGLPSATLDALAGQKELLSKLLGATIDLDASAQGLSASGGSFHLDAKSPALALASSGRIEKGAIVCSGKEGVDLTLHLPPGWLEEQVSPFLPAGARLSAPTDNAPLQFTLRDANIVLPSASATAVPAAATKPDAKAGASSPDSTKATLAAISKLALRASLSVPTLTYSDEATDAAKQPVTIRDAAFTVDLVPQKPPSATLRAKLDAATPGELNATVRALDPLDALADEKGAKSLDSFRVAFDVGASHVPTALVDAAAKQGGLLVDALGPRLEVSLKSAGLSRENGAFTASIDSEPHSMHVVEGHLDHGDVVIDKDGGLVAKVGITPLVSERLIGKLVPLFVDVQKPKDSAPAAFAVDSLRWPKDGDLSRLDALVRVNLGEVSYRLLPGLDAVFGASGPSVVKIPELRVPIQKGVASYAGMPIRIGGKDFTFKGTFNLASGVMSLGTDVPLAVLGHGVEAKLDGLRDVLGPDTLVPIEIRGTWKNPKVGVGSEFLSHALENAAKKELPGLIDGFLKKKKN
jgi:hypothetical protein